ncbi:MAG: Holliday junction branch migration protein RuvA, partial [Betaproteobacteria bacterium]
LGWLDRLPGGVVPARPRGATSESGDLAVALAALVDNDQEVQWAVTRLPAGTAVTDGIRQALKLLARA